MDVEKVDVFFSVPPHFFRFVVFFPALITCNNFVSHVGDRYDWTTGVPDNGNDWRKFRAVPRSYPLRSLVLYFV